MRILLLLTGVCLVLLIILRTSVVCVHCNNLPPGLMRMTQGVDITYVDFTPLDKDQPDGYRGGLFEFTCDEGKLWTNPYNNFTYQLPDQIWSIATKPSSTVVADWTMFRSINQFKSEEVKKLGVSFGFKSIFKPYFSLVTEKKMKYIMEAEHKSVMKGKIFVSSLSAVFAPVSTLRISPKLQSVIDSLPDRIEDDPEPYYHFLEETGTDYISMAELGGYLDIIFSLSNNHSIKIEGKTGKNVKKQLSGFFLEKFNCQNENVLEKLSKKRPTLDISKLLMEMGVRLNFHGGHTSLFDIKKIIEWEKSVPLNPWLYSGDLTPIYKLIKDDKKRLSMERAYDSYTSGPYIEQLIDNLKYAGKKYQYVDDASVISSLLIRTEAMQKLPVKNMSALEELVNKINFHLLPGEWWAETKLCLRNESPITENTNADNNNQESSIICAPSSHYSAFYYDKTDSKFNSQNWLSWGLLSPINSAFYYDKTDSKFNSQNWLSWGLLSPIYSDEWFKGIQICFWSSCAWTREFCSGLNKFTTKTHIESKYSIEGACGISWKLRAPNSENLPFWFRNTKVCVQLSGVHDDCKSENKQKVICASHNQWIPPIWFRLKGKHNDCGYQWGLIEVVQNT